VGEDALGRLGAAFFDVARDRPVAAMLADPVQASVLNLRVKRVGRRLVEPRDGGQPMRPATNHKEVQQLVLV